MSALMMGMLSESQSLVCWKPHTHAEMAMMTVGFIVFLIAFRVFMEWLGDHWINLSTGYPFISLVPMTPEEQAEVREHQRKNPPATCM